MIQCFGHTNFSNGSKYLFSLLDFANLKIYETASLHLTNYLNF